MVQKMASVAVMNSYLHAAHWIEFRLQGGRVHIKFRETGGRIAMFREAMDPDDDSDSVSSGSYSDSDQEHDGAIS